MSMSEKWGFSTRRTSVRIVALAFAYSLLGALSLYLSKPLDYAVFIWFPAGLAYVGLMVWGRRCWPGVWIGAFITALFVDSSFQGTSFALACASGVTLQAYVAVLLTRSLVRANFPVTKDRDLLAVLVLAGPVSCLISATIVTATLGIQGKIESFNWFGEWLLWWSADCLGIIIGGPLFLLAWPSALRMLVQRADAHRIALPLTAVAFLLLAGNFGYAFLERDRAQILTTQALVDISGSDFRQASAVLDPLRNIGNFFSKSGEVSSEEFDEHTNLAKKNPAVYAIDWAPLIPDAERAYFEEKLKLSTQQGNFKYIAAVGENIVKPASKKSEYFPIYYTKSAANRTEFIGLDHGSVEARQKVISRAIDSGSLASTPIEKLAQDGRPAILVFFPVFKKMGKNSENFQPATKGHQKELGGFIVGIYDVEKLFRPLYESSRQKNSVFRVVDVTPGSNAQILISNTPSDLATEKVHTLVFGDRVWQLEMASTAHAWRAGQSAESRIYLIFSVLAAMAAVFAVLGSAGRNANVIEQLAQKASDLENELQARHQAEKELSDSQQDLAITLHSIGEAVLTTDADGCVTRLNAVAEQMTGWTSAQALGQPAREVYVVYKNDGTNEVASPVDQVLRLGGQDISRSNMQLVSRDGHVWTVAHTAAPIRDQDENIRGAVLVFRDVSGEVSAQRELKVREERYRRLINLSPFAILVHCGGEIVFVNPMAVKMLAAESPSKLLSRNILEFVHQNSLSMIADRINRREEGDSSTITLECEGVRMDGIVLPILFTSTPYDFEGRKGSLLIVQDLSVRKEKQQLVDRFFTLSQDLLCIIGADGVFQRVNGSFTTALGWAEEELVTKNLIDFVHPEDRAATAQVLQVINDGIIIEEFENRYICKDGSWRRLEWKALPQPDGLFFASARDCTERHENAERMRILNSELAHRVEEHSAALTALHAKEQEVRAVLDNLLECVITIDSCGFIKTANPAVENIFGYAPSELIGKNVSILMGSPHREIHDSYISRYLTTRRARIIGSSREVIGRHRDGAEIPLELSLVEYHVHGDVFFVGTLHDIRARKQLILEITNAREAAEQANRAKSSFLASMSHEIRTPMNGVIGIVDVLDRTTLDEKQADFVRTIKDSSATLLGIIDNILDFSKIEAGNMLLDSTPVVLLDLVEGLCNTLLQTAIHGNVELHSFVSPDLPQKVISDEIRLHQILYNLVGNAIKFSSGNDAGSHGVFIRIVPYSRDPVKLCISVSDSGIGIPSEKINEIFDPFIQAEASTTRRFGGTGLGLAITKRLVDLMSGEIQVESEPGVGTTFRVILPMEAIHSEEYHHPVFDIQGVHCVFFNMDIPWVKDLQIYLRNENVITHEVSDYISVEKKILALDGPVIYVDCESVDRFKGAKMDGAMSRVSRLCLTKGRRRNARIQDANTVTIDVNALRKSAFLKAVAIAAGRVLPEEQNLFVQPTSSVRRVSPPTLKEAQVDGKLILVAEDDAVNQKVIFQQLALLGYFAQIAGDGKQAFAMWKTGSYALVLTDLHMPEMDGYTLVREIRAVQGPGARVPILALTANALHGEEYKALDAGADAYLTKPIRLDALDAALRKWMPSGKDTAQNKNKVSPIDIEAMKKIIGDAPEDINEFLGDFQSIASEYAKEIIIAAKDMDFSVVEAVSHKMKSAARFIGASALGDLSEKLEQLSHTRDEIEISPCVQAFEIEFSAVSQEVSKILLAQIPKEK